MGQEGFAKIRTPLSAPQSATVSPLPNLRCRAATAFSQIAESKHWSIMKIIVVTLAIILAIIEIIVNNYNVVMIVIIRTIVN